MKKHLVYILGLIALALVSRLIPHWPNFTAMIAVAFTGGLLFKNRLEAILIPLGVLFVSDLLINNTLYAAEGFTFFTSGFGYIYGAYVLIALLGALSARTSKLSQIFGAVSGALSFYLITNFGAWLANPMYSQDFSGLISSYTAGLPFLLNSVASTLFYGAIIYALKLSFEQNSEVAKA